VKLLVAERAAPSAATGAPKHAAHHQITLQQQIPANAYLSFASVRSTPPDQPSNMSPRGLERLEHLVQGFEDIGFKEDLGN
jgi:hypothetical protein